MESNSRNVQRTATPPRTSRRQRGPLPEPAPRNYQRIAAIDILFKGDISSPRWPFYISKYQEEIKTYIEMSEDKDCLWNKFEGATKRWLCRYCNSFDPEKCAAGYTDCPICKGNYHKTCIQSLVSLLSLLLTGASAASGGQCCIFR